MAIKYGIFGAAFNGDGTASNEAASDGAAGAWKLDQAAGGIFTGTTPTYGTLAAGDIVNIRSKTGNGANANISVTIAASTNYGNASGTAASPIRWVLDNGAIWSGVNGTLTYTVNSTSFSHTIRAGNKLISKTRNSLVFENTNAAPPSIWCTILGVVDGVLFNLPNKTSTNAAIVSFGNSGPHVNPSFYTLRTSSLANGGFIAPSSSTPPVRFINPSIEIGSAANAGAVFSSSQSFRFQITGGRLFGAGATTGITWAYGPGNTAFICTVESVGTDIPKAVTLAQPNGTNGNLVVSAIGLDGGAGGASYTYGGTVDSRNIDNFYPYLNATLADSVASGVSWRVAPSTGCSTESPVDLRVSKLYTDTAAAKTVTLEFLLPTSWSGGSMNKSTVWMDVFYIDNTTGLVVRESTYDDAAGSFSSSYAAWSATTWGAVGFGKKKLELTTAGSIKKDTAVTVHLFCTSASGSANDVLMVCPDVQLS